MTEPMPQEPRMDLGGDAVDRLVEKAEAGTITPVEMLALIRFKEAHENLVTAWEHMLFSTQQRLAAARSTLVMIQTTLLDLEWRAQEEEARRDQDLPHDEDWTHEDGEEGMEGLAGPVQEDQDG